MVPETAKKPIPRTCPICEKKLASKEALVNHIERVHSTQIPPDWSASRYENYLRTGVKHGNCTECGKPTEWNESTWKYNRLCNNPKCRQASANRAKKNMIAKHGVVHMLNDPEMQRKMIYSKKNSGAYYFTEDTDKKYKIMYASSEEKHFLEMLDVFLNMSPSDVIGPSPHTYTYKYEGKDHFYIPDYYISSLNLEIEIKEPANNQNKHPKIQAVDKVKEKLKDELMQSIRQINYIKINGQDYSQFFAFLSRLKECDDFNSPKPVRGVVESLKFDSVTEAKDLLDMVNQFNNLINNAKGLYNPKLNYTDVITNLDRQVRTCKKGDIDFVENQIMQAENLLIEASQKKPNEKGSENVYEATRALKVLQENIKPRFEEKKRTLLKVKVHMENADINYHNTVFVAEALITGFRDNKLYRPVFVVLSYTDTPAGKVIKQVTKQPYTHACLSFDTNMNKLMSFNMVVDSGKVGGGFTASESFKFGGYTNQGAYYAIYMYLASQDEYLTMENLVESFQKNVNSFKYSWKGCIDYLFHRKKSYDGEYFCSEFVADILKSANPNLLRKDANFYSPGDLALTRKLRLVDKGIIKNYDSHKVDIKVKKILEERGMQGVEIKE